MLLTVRPSTVVEVTIRSLARVMEMTISMVDLAMIRSQAAMATTPFGETISNRPQKIENKETSSHTTSKTMASPLAMIHYRAVKEAIRYMEDLEMTISTVTKATTSSTGTAAKILSTEVMEEISYTLALDGIPCLEAMGATTCTHAMEEMCSGEATVTKTKVRNRYSISLEQEKILRTTQ